LKKKKESAEEFVGWKSEDGLLEVVGIHGKIGRIKTFKVICHKCKEDKELFPLGYFVSVKSSLVNGLIPCGCSKVPKWNKEQFLIIARRTAKDRFIVHGFSEEFHGKNTKLDLECPIDGNRWTTTSIASVISNKTGCPECSHDSKRRDKQEVFDKCIAICETEGYKPLGFPNGYKNNKSRFEYRCEKHGIQNVSYDKFVNSANKCKGCWKEKQKEYGNGNGYFPERKDEKDFLYVLDFDSKFLKVGRSFDVDERIGNLKKPSSSGIKNIIKLRIFTATHKEIYDTEQAILEELRERGFQYPLNWTKECFENECLHSLNKLLDLCDLEELPIE